MARRWKIWAAGLGVLALAASGASGLADLGENTPLAESLAGEYRETFRFSGDELEPAGRHQRVLMREAAAKKTTTLKVKYYIGTTFQTVAPGQAQLFEVRCPRKNEQPLTGGLFAPTSGLVISNSSRTSPEPTFPTHERAWYEAAYNRTAAELAWKPFLTCARS
jgi:hypothetical protein